jgi:DNA-binding transcriptional ArsR family regulator
MSSSIGDANLAAVGALLADRARAKVLLALADGRSLPASVLAQEAGVAASTASHHLARLVEAEFITADVRGRHKYFSLAGPQVAELIEAVARMAPAQRVTSLREGTRAYAVRYARSCYDHLAGRLGVAVTDALREQGVLAHDVDAPVDTVTERGAAMLDALGVRAKEGSTVRLCMDWTEQRNHIAGPVARSLLMRLFDLGWLAREARTRAVRPTELGRTELPVRLGVELP